MLRKQHKQADYRGRMSFRHQFYSLNLCTQLALGSATAGMTAITAGMIGTVIEHGKPFTEQSETRHNIYGGLIYLGGALTVAAGKLGREGEVIARAANIADIRAHGSVPRITYHANGFSVRAPRRTVNEAKSYKETLVLPDYKPE